LFVFNELKHDSMQYYVMLYASSDQTFHLLFSWFYVALCFLTHGGSFISSW